MTKKQAEDYLYSLWENGLCNSNFTEDHSEYEYAVEILMKHGLLEFNNICGYLLLKS
jgi:hypothetical protein